MADISVAVMTNDPPDVLAFFVAAHLAAGVKRIYMFFDNPDNAYIPNAQVHPKIIPTICDDAFWAHTSKGERPENVENRQFVCYRLAYQRAETSWIGFCDADEILHSQNGFVKDLEDVPEDVVWVRAHVGEAVWPKESEDFSPFTASFVRRHHDLDDVITRPEKFHKVSKKGMVGPTSGKYIARTGLKGMYPGIHAVRRRDPETGKQVKIQGSWFDSRIGLVHFDAISFESWYSKHIRRHTGDIIMTGNPDRRELQTTMLASLPNKAEQLAFFKQLYTLSPSERAVLAEHSALLRLEISDKVWKLSRKLLNDPSRFGS